MAAPKLILPVLILSVAAWAQGPSKIGRAPTADEMKAIDIAINPVTGKELPPGQGTAVEGAKLFTAKGCAGCHGPNGYGGRAPTLIVPKGFPTGPGKGPEKVAGLMPGMEMGIESPGLMAVHAPFAPVIWDYINRGMPLNREGTLTPNEVYALTAFLLWKGEVIKEDEVMDQNTLPKVKMPHLDMAVESPVWKPGKRVTGYGY
jgi:S-disulfanyl-L-cysteine oxidoreductase SoxD